MEDAYTRYVVDYEQWFKHCKESNRRRNISMYRAKLIPDDPDYQKHEV